MAPIPHEQGALDGFCGLYSVINAVVVAAAPYRALGKKDCLDLFAFLVCALKLSGELAGVLISGGYYPMVSRLLKAANCWLVTRHGLSLAYRRPFHNSAKINPARALRKVERHLVQPNRAAIIRINGVYEHWTVARSVSAKTGTLHLADSGSYRYLRPRSLLGDRTRGSIRFVPRDVFLISVTNWPTNPAKTTPKCRTR